MSEQLCFAGFERQSANDRLFLALMPTAAGATRISRLINRLRDEHHLSGQPLAPPRLHVSLYGLGDYADMPQQLVDAARKAGDAVRLPPFDVTFDHVLSFYRKDEKRAFVLRPGGNIAALSEFHRALGSSMKSVGLARYVAPHFTPHMTLLYDRRMVAERSVDAVCCRVDGFVLIHSLLTRSRHVHLARWRLDG